MSVCTPSTIQNFMATGLIDWIATSVRITYDAGRGGVGGKATLMSQVYAVIINLLATILPDITCVFPPNAFQRAIFKYPCSPLTLMNNLSHALRR